jgi:hypothetical protein
MNDRDRNVGMRDCDTQSERFEVDKGMGESLLEFEDIARDKEKVLKGDNTYSSVITVWEHKYVTREILQTLSLLG